MFQGKFTLEYSPDGNQKTFRHPSEYKLASIVAVFMGDQEAYEQKSSFTHGYTPLRAFVWHERNTFTLLSEDCELESV